ncbi:hypothetical protein [Sphaerimonospora thailandensis]|uniref:Uncharacterized protein n=1 Tax=Sphaerimonospora thailandensis TaxID=795644 RepID=A0A8J3RAZ6_9ACTN|nr:hypothetical protein [Sphaerimonospora thailandensis]GIH70572.1 hypothetical protein Mth01_28250 [Sphaerimonospora thailandensis]
MFALLLGLAWLILTPVCVWLLFGRDRSGSVRAAAVVTLGTLQVATMVIGFANRHPTSTGPAGQAPIAEAPITGGGAGGAGVIDGATSSCPPRILSPEAVRLHRSGEALNVTVFWKAGTSQCDEAAVALHPSGKRLGILLREGGAAGEPLPGETRTAPVHVAQGMASLRLRFTPRRGHHKNYVAVNVHTGRRIPSARPGQYR